MVKNVYVLGFAFNSNDQVLLIKKNHPDWQAGKLNGLGGKKEKNEKPERAMVREFLEECGIETKPQDWLHFADMYGHLDDEDKSWKVSCLAARVENIAEYKQLESEKPFLVDIISLDKYFTISNVPWLVHMALNHLISGSDFTAEITYV